MPCHINGVVFADIRVLGLCVIGLCSLLALLAQIFIADVTDKAVGRTNLRPVAHVLGLLQHVQGIALGHIRQNRALNACAVADISVLLHGHGLCRTEFRFDIDAVHLVGHQLICKACIFLNIFQSHISRIAVHLHRCVILHAGLLRYRVGITSHRRGNQLRRRRIQQQIFLGIPVETGIQVIVQGIGGHIGLTVDDSGLKIHHLII